MVDMALRLAWSICLTRVFSVPSCTATQTATLSEREGLCPTSQDFVKYGQANHRQPDLTHISEQYLLELSGVFRPGNALPLAQRCFVLASPQAVVRQ